MEEKQVCTNGPCRECPFRCDSAPGWLGDSDPEEFMRTVLADVPMPCHLTIDYDVPNWKELWENGLMGVHCGGAAIFFTNICKVSRDSDRPRLEADHEQVFSRPEEFIAHHTIKAELPMDINVMRHMVDQLSTEQFQNLVDNLSWLNAFRQKIEGCDHPSAEPGYFTVSVEIGGDEHKSWVDLSVWDHNNNNKPFSEFIRLQIHSRGRDRVKFRVLRGPSSVVNKYYSTLEEAVSAVFRSLSYRALQRGKHLQLISECTGLDQAKYGDVKGWSFTYDEDEDD